MSGHDSSNRQFIQFYTTASYPCSYLAEERSRSQVAVSGERMSVQAFSQLVRLGFRRSGLFVYRPHCDFCRACIPVRLPVSSFTPSRTQQKIWRRQGDLQAELLPMRESAEHYFLYQRYQKSRHPGGGMDEDGYEQYRGFLLRSPVDTCLVEFRRNGVLKMVSVVDRLDDGWSAVYTFFEPDEPHASYGVYNVLWQAHQVRALGLEYLYLGYWIQQCRKMKYKADYRPLEALQDGVWLSLDPGGAVGDSRALRQ